MSLPPNQQFDLPLDTADARPSPFAQPLYFPSRNYLAFRCTSAIYIVTAEGDEGGFLIATLPAVVGFQGWAANQDDLFVLDGPVLQKYNVSNINESMDGPHMAVNVGKPKRVYARGDQPWSTARAWLYGAPSLLGALSPPVVLPDEHDRSVFVLQSNGSIYQFDKGLGAGTMVPQLTPDTLAARFETITTTGSQTYFCYAHDNQVVTLDPEHLRQSAVPVPDPLPSATGWVNKRNFAEAAQPWILMDPAGRFMPPSLWVSRVDGHYCLTGPVVAPPNRSIVLVDCGASAWPRIGQGGLTATPPSRMSSAAVNLGALQPAGVPWLRRIGGRYDAYLLARDAAGVLHYQKWNLPALAPDPLLQRQWSQAFNGMIQLRFMESLFPAQRMSPTGQSPWNVLAVASMMLDAGLSTLQEL